MADSAFSRLTFSQKAKFRQISAWRKDRIYKFLEWDSEFFGKRIAKLTGDTLTEEILESAFYWCRENKIDCLYFLANPEDKQTSKLAESHGFSLTDIKITLEIETSSYKRLEQKDLSSIRVARVEDIEQLKQLALVNHRDSRFYYDGNFSFRKCDELFAVWIENSCRGLADVVLVANRGDTVQGYITCSVDNEADGKIGLVGVSRDFQGRGIGKMLLDAALEWFEKNGARTVTVVTQGRNIKAQRLYQRNAFLTKSLEIWYHKWFHKN